LEDEFQIWKMSEQEAGLLRLSSSSRGKYMHQALASATFRIECGNSSGSGFSFRDTHTVVTNFHVVQPHTVDQGNIFVITDDEKKIPAKLVCSSDGTA
jgi:S1-C subfamily serine protease